MKMEQTLVSEMVQMPDDSGCFTASYPLPVDHWLYCEVENDGTIESQLKLAIKEATDNGTIFDFDPDALMQSFRKHREPHAVKQSFDTIKKAMHEDYSYAWSWHCNIAVPAMDEGLPHEAANKAAARFMYNAFELDTTSPPKGMEENDISDVEIAELSESYKELHKTEIVYPSGFTDPINDVE